MKTPEIYNEEKSKVIEGQANRIDELLQARKLVAKDEATLRVLEDRLRRLVDRGRNSSSQPLTMEEKLLKDLISALVYEKGADPKELDQNMKNYHDYSEEWMGKAMEEIADLVVVAE